MNVGFSVRILTHDVKHLEIEYVEATLQHQSALRLTVGELSAVVDLREFVETAKWIERAEPR